MAPRLLLLSSITARDGSGGELLLHRHLQPLAGRFEIHQASFEFKGPSPYSTCHVLPRRGLFLRLQNTRYFLFFWALNHPLSRLTPRSELDRLYRAVRPDVILTVAEGQLMATARRCAQRWGVPLVSVFHDWSSVWLPGPAWIKRLFDRELVKLYRASRTNLCVSPELIARLGPHPGARWLPPIPSTEVGTSGPLVRAVPLRDTERTDAPGRASLPQTSALGTTRSTFKTVYAGAMSGLYFDDLEALVLAFHAAPNSPALELYGPKPYRDTPLLSDAALRPYYHGFVERPVLNAALAEADVLLVVQPFRSSLRPFVRYNFPSKIPEYCRQKKPILIWAPTHSTAANWARRTGGALVVEDSAPAAVAAALKRLEADPGLRAQLAAAAAQEGETTFSPARLQLEFENGLR